MPLPLTPIGAIVSAQTQIAGIMLLRNANAKADCDAYAANVLGVLDDSGFLPADNNKPNAYVARSGGSAVLWIDGTNNLLQAAGQVNGYVGAPTDSRFDPQSTAINNAAVDILEWAYTVIGAFAGQMFCAGWSFGGAIAHYIAKLRPVPDGETPVTGCISFGAPRVGGRSNCGDIRRSGIHQRWMNDTDPVPLLPPTLTDFPPILPLFGVAGCIRAQNFLHATGGITLFPDGNVQADIVPPGGIINFVGSLQAWLQTEDNDPTNVHWIGEYLRRLNLAAAQRRRDVNLDHGQAEQPGHQVSMKTNREAQRINRAINVLGQEQADVEPTIPKEHLFSYENLGGVHTVFFGDLPVATCNTKRRARAMRNAGNALLEKTVIQAIVDPATFVEQFQQFMTLAADPASGFEPTLNTKWPT